MLLWLDAAMAGAASHLMKAEGSLIHAEPHEAVSYPPDPPRETHAATLHPCLSDASYPPDPLRETCLCMPVFFAFLAQKKHFKKNKVQKRAVRHRKGVSAKFTFRTFASCSKRGWKRLFPLDD